MKLSRAVLLVGVTLAVAAGQGHAREPQKMQPAKCQVTEGKKTPRTKCVDENKPRKNAVVAPSQKAPRDRM